MGSGFSKKRDPAAASATPAAPSEAVQSTTSSQPQTEQALVSRHSTAARREASDTSNPARVTRGESVRSDTAALQPLPPVASDAAEPSAYKCPLTHQLMVDPVVDPEGNTYERQAIENWLQRNETSPITRSFLSSSMLHPNRALREAIETFRQQRGEALPVAAPPALVPEAPFEPEIPEQMIELSAKMFGTPGGCDMSFEICVQPPEGTTAMPMDIVLVVDVSGSMDAAALVDQGGTQVDVGFSVMDITKHALNTVIEALNPIDRLCIVAFSTSATVVMPMTSMNEGNQARAKNLVETLQPGGTTNLWDGLRLALREVETTRRRGQAMASIFVLTDGAPTEYLMPPRGIVDTLKAQLQKSMLQMPTSNSEAPQAEQEGGGVIPPTIYTFGFGYALDTRMLVDIARVGKGCFSFIPDSGFVGTVLVHTLANVATTAGKYGALTFSAPENAKITIPGHDVEELGGGKLGISLDSIAFGQARKVVVKTSFKEGTEPPSSGRLLQVDLSYCNAKGQMMVPPTVAISVEGSGGVAAGTEVEATILRLELQDVLAKIFSKNMSLDGSEQLVKEFVAKNARFQAFENTRALLSDAEGQVLMAVSRQDYYSRWGINYVASLLSAHRQQRCNNFKDLGIAYYGGRLFQQHRDRADELFSNLPPPVASHQVRSNIDSGGKTQPVNFAAAFNSSNNPCFHHDALVRMQDASYTKVSDLKKGDQVAAVCLPPAHAHAQQHESRGGSSTLGAAQRTAPIAAPRVVCVVRTDCMGAREKLVALNGGKLLVTPWHPVCVEDVWVFPAEIAVQEDAACPAVYSVLLDSGHALEVGGVVAVTLGHGIEEDAVASHEYFGSQRVVKDLKGLPGFSCGKLHFRHGCIQRDACGRVLGFSSQHLFPDFPEE